MSERFTEKDAERALYRLAQYTGLPLATPDREGLALDRVPCHALWRIITLRPDHTQGDPGIGSGAYTARELVDHVHFLTTALIAMSRAQQPEAGYWRPPFTVTPGPAVEVPA